MPRTRISSSTIAAWSQNGLRLSHASGPPRLVPKFIATEPTLEDPALGLLSESFQRIRSVEADKRALASRIRFTKLAIARTQGWRTLRRSVPTWKFGTLGGREAIVRTTNNDWSRGMKNQADRRAKWKANRRQTGQYVTISLRDNMISQSRRMAAELSPIERLRRREQRIMQARISKKRSRYGPGSTVNPEELLSALPSSIAPESKTREAWSPSGGIIMSRAEFAHAWSWATTFYGQFWWDDVCRAGKAFRNKEQVAAFFAKPLETDDADELSWGGSLKDDTQISRMEIHELLLSGDRPNEPIISAHPQEVDEQQQSGPGGGPEAEGQVSPKELHHLLRLSALPMPKSDEEEQGMLRTLEAQLAFVKAVQGIDTTGVEPLVAIRDETEESMRKSEITMDSLRSVLELEEQVGRYKRVVPSKKAKEGFREPTQERDRLDWDPISRAASKTGRFIKVNTKQN